MVKEKIRDIVNRLLCIVIGHDGTVCSHTITFNEVWEVDFIAEWHCKYCGKFTGSVVNWRGTTSIPKVINKPAKEITKQEIIEIISEMKAKGIWY